MITFTPHYSSSAGNLYTVTDGESTLMLECGVGITKIRQALNHKLHQVAACLVTHEHKDHSRAVMDVIGAGVDVFCSYGTAAALGLAGHRVNLITALDQFRMGPWVVLPFDIEHDAAEPVGFLIQNEEDKLLFAADTFYIRYQFQGLTHIAIECNYSKDCMHEDTPLAHKLRVMRSHMSLETVLAFLHANDLSRVREIHLLHLSDDNSDEHAFKTAVQAATGIPAQVAKKSHNSAGSGPLLPRSGSYGG
jgi:phosphoribosyl 1,2-cyclic phosphodiesterase